LGLTVNDHHRLNVHGLDLLTYFEKGDPSVALSENGAALEPYVCPGDKLTIGYGCTRWFDGRDIAPTDRLRDEIQARELLTEQLVEYEVAVRELVTVELNSNQFSALVCFAFNCGIKGLGGSTLLKYVNARLYDDAADSFGMWIYATSGQHKRALRGLLRRRYAEACLWMGYQFEDACDDDFIRIKVERPADLIGTDKVLFKTPFKDVLVIAQRYPLLSLDTPAPSPPKADEVAQRQTVPAQAPAAGAASVIEKPSATVSGQAEAVPVQPTKPVALQPSAVGPAPAPVATGAVVKVPAPAPVGTKPPSENTKMPEHVPYRIDPTAGLKPLEETERFVGAALMLFGTFARVIMANGTALTGVGGVIVVGVLDMMKSPTNLAILVTVITMAITGALWVVAFIIDKLGLKIKKRGEATSTQAMY
jgi:lysozyme